MPISLDNMMKGTSETAAKITGSVGNWISTHPYQLMLILEGAAIVGGLAFAIKTWLDQLPETKIIMIRGKNKCKVFGKKITGDKWTWGEGEDAETYLVPAHPLTIDEGILGTKPLVIYEEGNPRPLFYNKRTGAIEIDEMSASAFKKVIDNEQLKILTTLRTSQKDLIMGIAIGAACVLLLLFLGAAFKFFTFGKCPVCPGA